MNEQTNPFVTMHEAMTLLRVYGLDTVGGESTWYEKVLGITMNKIYLEGTHCYDVCVHLNMDGFIEAASIVAKLDIKPTVNPTYSPNFTEHRIDLEPRLCLIALEQVQNVGV